VNIKLTLEYDGTNYHGWQIQAHGNTIQAILERGLTTFFGTPIRVIGSGRTDAGVHARGQVVNFRIEKPFHRHRLLRGINALTPADIAIKEAELVPDSFDARRDGRARVYEYHILNRSMPSPFYLNRAWHLHEALDIATMRAAVGCLLGEHDFSAFRAAGCDAAHPVRRVYGVALETQGELLVFRIEATAFLRHMVRNIVGTLVEIGQGLRPADSLSTLLELKDRTKSGPTAPAHGLYLMEVKY
jgi:tRNA pseudouridine38-40 synthase